MPNFPQRVSRLMLFARHPSLDYPYITLPIADTVPFQSRVLPLQLDNSAFPSLLHVARQRAAGSDPIKIETWGGRIFLQDDRRLFERAHGADQILNKFLGAPKCHHDVLPGSGSSTTKPPVTAACN